MNTSLTCICNEIININFTNNYKKYIGNCNHFDYWFSDLESNLKLHINIYNYTTVYYLSCDFNKKIIEIFDIYNFSPIYFNSCLDNINLNKIMSKYNNILSIK